MGTIRSKRPPAGFVLITRTRWRELCSRVGANPAALTLEHDGAPLGWRSTGVHFAEPGAYRRAMGAWPDGYWPDAGA